MEYKLEGRQMVSIHLKMGEKVYADPGKLVGKSSTVKMNPAFVGGIANALKRRVVGTSLLLTEFEARDGPGVVSFAGVLPGKTLGIELKEGEQFIAENYSFLVAESSTSFTIKPVNIGAAFFGGAGLILQKFVGPGMIFIQAVGDMVIYDLDGTASFDVEPGHIAGFDSSIDFNIKFMDNVKSMMFAKEGIFLATFSGKGRVMLHSVSRFKLTQTLFIEGEEETKSKIK